MFFLGILTIKYLVKKVSFTKKSTKFLIRFNSDEKPK